MFLLVLKNPERLSCLKQNESGQGRLAWGCWLGLWVKKLTKIEKPTLLCIFENFVQICIMNDR